MPNSKDPVDSHDFCHPLQYALAEQAGTSAIEMGRETASRNLAAKGLQLLGGGKLPGENLCYVFGVAAFTKNIDKGRHKHRCVVGLGESLACFFQTFLFQFYFLVTLLSRSAVITWGHH